MYAAVTSGRRYSMSNIITIKGINMLLEKKKKKEPLPEGWKLDVANYVLMKERAMNQWMKEYFDACDDYNFAVEKEKMLHGFGKD